jgi:DNA polymerase III gamma/tau subunit
VKEKINFLTFAFTKAYTTLNQIFQYKGLVKKMLQNIFSIYNKGLIFAKSKQMKNGEKSINGKMKYK